jgi:hypothetical protein
MIALISAKCLYEAVTVKASRPRTALSVYRRPSTSAGRSPTIAVLEESLEKEDVSDPDQDTSWPGGC